MVMEAGKSTLTFGVGQQVKSADHLLENSPLLGVVGLSVPSGPPADWVSPRHTGRTTCFPRSPLIKLVSSESTCN